MKRDPKNNWYFYESIYLIILIIYIYSLFKVKRTSVNNGLVIYLQRYNGYVSNYNI